jgi:hypothetical protein
VVSNIRATSANVSLEFAGGRSVFQSSNGFSSTSVVIDNSRVLVTTLTGFDITLTSNAVECIVDICSGTSITNNGSGNTVGDIT